jgi:hypothetical protein
MFAAIRRVYPRVSGLAAEPLKRAAQLTLR